MCDFHLNGNCFHPNKVQRGWVATTCEVHSCMDCTNPHWQTKIIQQQRDHHQQLLDMIDLPVTKEELQQPIRNTLFNRFKIRVK